MNRYRILINGRFCSYVDGYKEALASRHTAMVFFWQSCPDAVNCDSLCILDTPAVSMCCACTRYCSATIHRVEARHG